MSDFNKSVCRPDIPESYKVDDELYKSNKADEAKLKDMAWSLSRIEVIENHVSVLPMTQSMPSWSARNSIWSEETIPVKILTFLPVLPYPVTQYATVYSAMKNFGSICFQLVQREILMYCDEGVYSIVKDIQLMRSEEIQTLVPVMRTFHLVKIVLKYIGKALDGSGADYTWLQADVFGPSVVQNSVLNDGHYGLSLAGMQLLAEAVKCLLY